MILTLYLMMASFDPFNDSHQRRSSRSNSFG
jgi:hypothetical protein